MSEQIDLTDYADSDSEEDSEWVEKRLGEIFDSIYSGGTPKKGVDEYYGGDIPFVKIEDLNEQQGNGITTAENYITEQALEETSTRAFEPKTLLMTIYGSLAETAIVQSRVATNQGILGLWDADEDNVIYVRYAIDNSQPKLASLSRQTTQANLGKGIVKKHKIPIPPLPEQRKIATVLYTVDRAIENTEKIINQTKRVQRGYIKQQVLSLDSDCDRQGSAVGTRRVSIPKSWETVRLGDVARIVSGNSFPRDYQEGHAGSRAVIKVEDMNLSGNDKYIVEVTNRVTDDVLDELSKNVFPENTVIHPRVGEALLLNKTRITGEVAAFDDNIMGWVPVGIDPEYLYYASTLIDFNAVAQTGTVPSINKEMAANFRFPLPPEEEQKRIAEDISRVDGQISIYEDEKNRLKRLKQGLMQDLLSGTVRTTDADIDVPDEIAQHG